LYQFDDIKSRPIHLNILYTYAYTGSPISFVYVQCNIVYGEKIFSAATYYSSILGWNDSKRMVS
jgi:hypothetical protein